MQPPSARGAPQSIPSQDDLRDAKRTLASLLMKLRKAKAKLVPGSAQATLAQNRIKALRIALVLIAASHAPARRVRSTAPRPTPVVEHPTNPALV